MDDKEAIRRLMTKQYNPQEGQPKRFLRWHKSDAQTQIKCAEEQIQKAKKEIAEAELAIGLLTLAEQYGWKLWDVSDHFPEPEWTFVGTDEEYAEKMKALGVSKKDIQDTIKQYNER